MDRAPVDPILSPRTVAVIGASRRRGTIGGELLHNLLRAGFAGAIYPVNPAVHAVQGVRAWPSIASIPDDIDLAVLAVPAAHVLREVEACGQKGVRGIVVITAGFGELGPAGRQVQDELVAIVRKYGMRMVGPNCLGVQNRDPEVCLNATFSPAWPTPGHVSIASQSGALGQAILEHARELGLGVRHFVSMGNKADVSGNDLLEHWGRDPATRVILLYLESFGNSSQFHDIARRITRQKPILMVKSGRSEAGAHAASSHTGALAGLDVAVDALLGQSGVLRADTLEELFDLAMLLANQPVPRGRRVAIVTNAGGPGIMATDACAAQGLVLPDLSPHVRDALTAILPPEASVRNPVDMIASASAEGYRRAVELLCADPNFDAVLVIFVPPIVTDAADVASAICQAVQGADKPVVACFLGKHGMTEALSSLRQGHIPSYTFPESAAIALARAAAYGDWLRRPTGQVHTLPRSAHAQITDVLDAVPAGAWLQPDAVRAVLQAAGIPVLGDVLLRDPDVADSDLAEAARAIGYPVALKVFGSAIVHKSDIGGVALGVADDAALGQALAHMRASVAAHGLANAVEGWYLQAMAPAGVECFAGLTRDPAFGPLVAFGLGGVAVEVWRDVGFRLAPLDDVDARDLLESIRGVKLLDGWRGAAPADRAALADVLQRVAALGVEFPQLAELDINPLTALAPGHGVRAVDARIRKA